MAARHLRIRARVRLRGDFSFDAVSPDGRSVFLIHYTSPSDPTRYEVRVLDVASRRLVRAPVLDPREPDEAMRGMPQSRAVGAGGRWAYTLYTGGEHPFVHALDTAGRTARCIDLPPLPGDPATFRVRMAPGGRAVRVITGGALRYVLDTRTWAVQRPGGFLAGLAAVLLGATPLPGARSPAPPRAQ